MQCLKNLTLVAAGSLAVTACVPPPWTPADFIPHDSVGLRECLPAASSNTIVRVLVPADLSTIGARRVRYKIYAGGGVAFQDDVDEYNDPLAKPNDGGVTEFKQNRYHINVNTIDRSPGDQFIKVRVILLNPRLEFFRVPRADPVRDVQGVALAEGAPQAEWFCQNDAEAITRPKQYSIATFYIRRHQPNTPVLGDASVNLFMRATGANGQQTPIILDPKIKNNG